VARQLRSSQLAISPAPAPKSSADGGLYSESCSDQAMQAKQDINRTNDSFRSDSSRLSVEASLVVRLKSGVQKSLRQKRESTFLPSPRFLPTLEITEMTRGPPSFLGRIPVPRLFSIFGCLCSLPLWFLTADPPYGGSRPGSHLAAKIAIFPRGTVRPASDG
jgi:hypothetical protein